MKKNFTNLQYKIIALAFIFGCLLPGSIASAQCTNGTGGGNFTPSYTGNIETIQSIGSGHYATVNILPNKYYTFVSILTNQTGQGYTGYITITNGDGSLVLASGNSPLFYQSTAGDPDTIRYYIHGSASCTSSTTPHSYSIISYNSFCEAPTNLLTTNVSDTSATLTWTAPPSTPANGYQYYLSTTSTPPLNIMDTAPTGYTLTNSKTLTNLNQNTTYYWWVRSTCGTQNTVWMGYRSFTTSATVCNQPTNLTVSDITGTSVVLSWTAPTPTPANGYYFAFNSTGSTPTNSFSTTTTSGTISVLQPNTTYYWWVRSHCGFSIVSPWLFGGSFTTSNGVFCNLATYGLYPAATYTPSCTGSPENIAIDAYAGEYSNVAININTQYTFTSSVPTDYITISNAAGDTLYANGTTPLTWNSTTNSGTIRYYFHSGSACGSENIERTRSITCNSGTSCNPPTTLLSSNITSNSAKISWTASVSSGVSYDVYFSTANTAPTASTAPSGNVTTVSALLTSLLPETNYYYWVRSNCGTSKSVWIAGGFLTTNTGLNCNGASGGLYPDTTFTPACTGATETIVTDAYAGEYSNVNINGNTQYTFTSSVSTDFISITDTAGTTLLASGVTPLIWSSGSTSGVLRYFLHANTSCGTESVNRTRYIKCTASTGCGLPSSPVKTNITSNSAQITWTGSSTAGVTYDVYFSVTSTAPTSATTPSGTVTTLSAILNNLISSTMYFVWVRTNCGTTTSAWVNCGTFTTNPSLNCNGAVYGLYPTATFTPACTGTAETIVTDAYAGEFSRIAIASNKQYTFSSSVATDYITITNETGNTVYASGTSPLAWSSGLNTGTVRYFLHSNGSCATQAQNRTRLISCTNSLDSAEFESKSIRVFPNPTDGELTITAATPIDLVEICSVLGQSVWVGSPASMELKINLTEYPTGIYFVRVHTNGNKAVYKIMKK